MTTIKTTELKDTIESITIYKGGMRINGKYYKCSYHEFKTDIGSVVFYNRYVIEKYFTNVYNDTDVMRDYFDDDKIYVSKDSDLYNKIVAKVYCLGKA